MQAYIVPTYECNLDCKGCYSKKYVKEFEQYLSWENFINIFNLLRYKYRNFAFIGGEPVKWKFINEAILYLKNKNKKTTVFTNGIIPIDVNPTNMVINGTNLFDANLRTVILKQIEQYRKKGIYIVLRFNIDDRITSDMLNDAVEVSKKYSDAVSVSVLFPATMDKKDGDKIYSLCTKLVKNGINTRISRATPLCIFSTEQRHYLHHKCKLSGQCSLPSNSIVIQPDGKTIQACVDLQLRKDINSLISDEPKYIFKKEIEIIKNKPNSICMGCEFFDNKQCCGGCLAYNRSCSFSGATHFEQG